VISERRIKEIERNPAHSTRGTTSDAIGRRPSGVLLSFNAALSLVLAGYYHDVFTGSVSVFYLMLFGQRFFGDGGYAVVGPYAAEVWPSRLRASGMGFGLASAILVTSSDLSGWR
jgi:MFS family permease